MTDEYMVTVTPKNGSPLVWGPLPIEKAVDEGFAAKNESNNMAITLVTD